GPTVQLVSSIEQLNKVLSRGQQPPDALITDYSLGRESGAEAIQLARQMVSHLPAILVTGSLESEPELLALLGVHLLRKPFSARGLEAVLLSLLGGSLAKVSA